MERWSKTDICGHCGAPIYLIKTGRNMYRWVTDPNKPNRWKCRPTTDYPLRSHAPRPTAA